MESPPDPLYNEFPKSPSPWVFLGLLVRPIEKERREKDDNNKNHIGNVGAHFYLEGAEGAGGAEGAEGAPPFAPRWVPPHGRA